MKNKGTHIAIAIVCIILAMAITVQVRTMKKEESSVSVKLANSELKDNLLKWKEKSENAEADLEKSTKELEKIRQTSSTGDNNSAQKAEELKRYNMLLGLTDVTGEGITLTLSDSSGESGVLDLSSLIVHDRDLKMIVNELANAGAEAISINGERIVNTTCITCAGNVIQINGNKVGSPFVIKAIGNQASLYGAITRTGGYAYYLKSNSIGVDAKKSNNIQINKFSGALTQKTMKSKN